jgi:hypothetical protein
MSALKQPLLPGFSDSSLLDLANLELSSLKPTEIPLDYRPVANSPKITELDSSFFFETGRNLKDLLQGYLSTHHACDNENPDWFAKTALQDPVSILVTFANNYNPKGGYWETCVAAVTSTIHQAENTQEADREALIGKLREFYLAIPTDYNHHDLAKIGLTDRNRADKLATALREYFTLLDFKHSSLSDLATPRKSPK